MANQINLINPYGAYREARMQREDRDAMSVRSRLADMYAGNQDQRAQQQSDLQMRKFETDKEAADQAAFTAEEMQQLKQSYTEVQRILAAPLGQRKAVADTLFDDEDRVELRNEGIDYDTLDDNGIAELASRLENQLGSRLGVGPAAPAKPDAFTLGPGQKRFVDGKEVAAVAPSKKSGIRMTNPDGTVVEIGGEPGAPVDLTGPTKNKLQDAFVNAQGNAMSLQQQLSKYDPSFSTYQTKAGAWWTNQKQKAGIQVAPEEAQKVEAYSAWKSDTLAMLSQYLNQMSGAAVSPTEEVRLRGSFPNENDSPSEYKAKADATMRRFALVQARAAYLLSHPELRLEAVSIDSMQNRMMSEANALAASLKRGGMSEDEAKQEAIKKTRGRYGL